MTTPSMKRMIARAVDIAAEKSEAYHPPHNEPDVSKECADDQMRMAWEEFTARTGITVAE